MPSPGALHPLEITEKEVEATHPGLGRLVAFAVLCAKARRCLLIVAPPGCGKSTSTQALGALLPNSLILDSITRAGLVFFASEFTGGTQSVVIDDLAKVDGTYSRIQTLVTMTELTYSHYVSKHSHQLSIQIDNFRGSCVMNLQPGILREVISSPEWDSSIADKSLRYYHLYRPLSPFPGPPRVTVRVGRHIDRTDPPQSSLEGFEHCLEISRAQHSESRALEHCRELLRGAAALGNRRHPTPRDAAVVSRLMQPMAIEEDLFDRVDLEAPRKMNPSVLPILTEFATHKTPTLALISHNYRLSLGRVRSIIRGMPDLFAVIDKQPTRVGAKKAIVQILAKGGDPHFQKLLKEIEDHGKHQRTSPTARSHEVNGGDVPHGGPTRSSGYC